MSMFDCGSCIAKIPFDPFWPPIPWFVTYKGPPVVSFCDSRVACIFPTLAVPGSGIPWRRETWPDYSVVPENCPALEETGRLATEGGDGNAAVDEQGGMNGDDEAAGK